MRPKRAPSRVLTALLLLVGIVLVVGSLVSSSPSVCGLCHGAQARSLAASPHRNVGCYGCHLASGGWSVLEAKSEELFTMYPAYLGGRRSVSAGVRISRAACTACHEWTPETASAGGVRIVHAKCAAAPAKCDSCHSDVAHPGAVRWARTTDMGACIGCHAATDARVGCSACHVGEAPKSRPATGTLGVVHGRRWEKTHGMADLRTCSACHQPSKCASCHETTLPHPVGFAASHGGQARAAGAKCSMCHQDSAMCDACHGLPMPHPADIRPKHGTLATSLDDPRCLKCHREFDCRNCHARHGHPRSTDGSLKSRPLPSGATP